MLRHSIAVGCLVLEASLGLGACTAPDGPQGADGLPGANGTNGANGSSGLNGEAGAEGPPGDAGAQGPAGLSVGFPTGSVIAFAGPAAQVPTGWVLCNGAAVSRTGATYSALFTVIGTLHGSGDGTTTFNLPDYRGRFLRGTDDGSGRDPDVASRTASNNGGSTGDNVGSVEGTATRLPNTPFTTDSQGEHTHTAAADVYKGMGAPDGSNFGGGGTAFNPIVINPAGAHTHTITGGGDSESRPPNADVNYIIKL